MLAGRCAVLCGNNGEACFAKYGCYPLHRAYCHEQALRILLASIQTHAGESAAQYRLVGRRWYRCGVLSSCGH